VAGRVVLPRTLSFQRVRFPTEPRSPRPLLTAQDIAFREAARIRARREADPVAEQRRQAARLIALQAPIRAVSDRFKRLFEDFPVTDVDSARRAVAEIRRVQNEARFLPLEVWEATGLDRIAAMSDEELFRRVAAVHNVPVTEQVPGRLTYERIGPPPEEEPRMTPEAAALVGLSPVDVAARINGGEPIATRFFEQVRQAAASGDQEAQGVLDVLEPLLSEDRMPKEKGGSEGDEGLGPNAPFANPPVTAPSPPPTLLPRTRTARATEGEPQRDVLVVFGDWVRRQPRPSERIPQPMPEPVDPFSQGPPEPPAPPPFSGAPPAPQRRETILEPSDLTVRRNIRIVEGPPEERPIEHQPLEVPTTAESEAFLAESRRMLKEVKSDRDFLRLPLHRVAPSMAAYTRSLENGDWGKAAIALSNVAQELAFAVEERSERVQRLVSDRYLEMVRRFENEIREIPIDVIVTQMGEQLVENAGRLATSSRITIEGAIKREADAMISRLDEVNRRVGRTVFDTKAIADGLDRVAREFVEERGKAFEQRLREERERALARRIPRGGRRGERGEEDEIEIPEEAEPILELGSDDFYALQQGNFQRDGGILQAVWRSLTPAEKRVINRAWASLQAVRERERQSEAERREAEARRVEQRRAEEAEARRRRREIEAFNLPPGTP